LLLEKLANRSDMSVAFSKIEVLKRKDLSPSQHLEMISLCSLSYNEDFKPLLETFMDPTHVLAYVDKKLVSHALWITRWLEYDHALMLRTAYIEAVATHPAFQNRGFGTHVMRVVHTKILNYDMGGLSPSDDRWYMRLGWERWQGPLFIRTSESLLSTPSGDLMILRLPRTPNLDLKAPLSAEWREGELW
jgi:aminoglycoside 2'-N-acetyltransferase I